MATSEIDAEEVAAVAATEETDPPGNGNPNLSDHSTGECLDDPNFATICSFIEKFGELIRLGELPFDELQIMLENTTEVPDALVKLHISLLRRVFKSIIPDKWEKSLAKFGHTYCNQDGWEIERFGYKKSKLQTKLRILKNLMEAQFDFNVKFKSEVNKLQAGDLRMMPLGRDCEGQLYWYQVDNDANLRVYREDIDDETWEIVASTREEFCELISKLQNGDVKKPVEAIVVDEDSNEKEIETKEILLDTGKVEDDEEDEDEEESDEETDEESEDEESLGIIVPSKIDKTPPKLSPVPNILPPESCKVTHEEVADGNTSEMDVDDHSDEMEIDESPPKLSEPVAIKLSPNSDDKLPTVDQELMKPNFNLNPKSDHVKDEEQTLTTNSMKVPVREEAVVKHEAKVLKTEYKPYQKDENEKAVVVKLPLSSVSEPLKTDEIDSSALKVESASILAKIESEIITQDKPTVVIKSSKKAYNKEENLQSIIDDTKSDKITVEETITKTDAWICGKDVKVSEQKNIGETITKGKDTEPSSPKLSVQVEEKLFKITKPGDDAIKDCADTLKDVDDSVRAEPIVVLGSEELKNITLEPASDTLEVEKFSASYLETQILEAEDASQDKESSKLDTTDIGKEYKNEALIETVKQETSLMRSEISTTDADLGSNGLLHDAKLQPDATSDLKPVLLEPVLKISDVIDPGALTAKLEVKDEPATQAMGEATPVEDCTGRASGIEKIKVETVDIPKAEPIQEGDAKAVDISESGPIKEEQRPEAETMPKVEPLQEPKTEAIETARVETITNITVSEPETISFEIESQSIKTESPIPDPVVELTPIAMAETDVVLPNTVPHQIESETSTSPSVPHEKQQMNSREPVVEPCQISPEPITQNSQVGVPVSVTLSKDPFKPSFTKAPVKVDEEEPIETEKKVDRNLPEETPQSMNPFQDENVVPLPNSNDQSSCATVEDLTYPVEKLQRGIEIEIQPEPEQKRIPATLPVTNAKHDAIGATADVSKLNSVMDNDSLPKTSLLGLVSYDSSSEDESMDESVKSSKKEFKSEKKSNEDKELLPNADLSDNGFKRKAEEAVETPSKMPKLSSDDIPSTETFNPIVGEAVEEELIMITGEGSGAQNDGGNDELDLKSNHKENIRNGNEANNSDNKTEGTDPTSSVNEDSQESLEVIKTPQKRGRPPTKGKKPVGPKSSTTSAERKPRSAAGAPKGRREIARLGVPLDSLEVNGSGDTSNERPVRASRRIAQIRQKEEEERRQLEEERLAQLKAAQLRKKQKQAEAAKLKVVGEEGKVLKSKGSKAAKIKHEDYMPSPSASDSNSAADEGEDYEDEEGAKKGKTKKKKKRGKNGRHKTGNPWATSSDESDSEAVEEEEEYHYEEEEQLVFNESDHEFSPESDVEEDKDAAPSRHARTAKRGEIDKEEETGCRKCGKGDHPEWILLCDKCDQGWHASCLRPQLWVIPEGEWFCPPCQHNLLIFKMNENLIEFDKLYKRRENDILRKQRLAFVGISLNNVLPTPEKEEQVEDKKSFDDRRRERKHRRRIILSDEEISDHFIDDGSGRSDGSSDEDSGGGPIYRLRTRRGAKTFDYKAYDDMINSAIRESDEEIEEVAEVEEEVEESANVEVNGDEEEKVPVEVEHSGKNEAFEKHLEDPEEETDEELLGEKERLKRREKKKAAQKKKKRSFRDLDDYTDEDNSDEDFKGSDGQDDDENDEDAVEEDESEWSGDKDDSDDSLAARSRNRGKKGKYGRREEYLDVGTVRRSTRRRKARVSYDESDQEEEEEGEDKWNSEESDAEETPSESDDETYGKRKKQKKVQPRSAVPRFFLGAIGSKSPAKKATSAKKKKRRVDEDDVDRAWSSSQGSKAKKKAAEETVERRTRGRKINFKDILDSGESDDDGNIRPKRRRISSDDDEEASTSRRLAEEIKAANQREAAMYAAQQQKQGTSVGKKSDSASASVPSSVEGENESNDNEDQKSIPPPQLSQPPPGASSAVTEQIILEKTSNLDKPPKLELEMALAKPVPAPPLPPALAKALGRSNKSSKAPAGSGEKSPSKSQPNHSNTPHIPVSSIPITSGTSPSSGTSGGPINNSGISSISTMPAGTPPISTMSQGASGIPHISTVSSISGIPPAITTSSKKGASPMVSVGSPPMKSSITPPMTLASPMRPIASPMQQQPHGVLSHGLPPGLPMDIGRVPNPTLYQGNPAMRPYHPMWVRNPGPPPYGTGGIPPPSIGKPPPLNSSAFMGQHGPPRPGYPSPPPLRIPNPNTSPLQAFQHFKRDPPHGPGMYRMPPGQLLQGGLGPHQGPPERFFGAPSPYPPYNILPPHTQSQPPQSLFSASQYDFRPGEPFKDERRGTPPGPSSPPSSGTAGATKEESSQQESEFGGLVSYFSSQRSEEDMDT